MRYFVKNLELGDSFENKNFVFSKEALPATRMGNGSCVKNPCSYSVPINALPSGAGCIARRYPTIWVGIDSIQFLLESGKYAITSGAIACSVQLGNSTLAVVAKEVNGHWYFQSGDSYFYYTSAYGWVYIPSSTLELGEEPTEYQDENSEWQGDVFYVFETGSDTSTDGSGTSGTSIMTGRGTLKNQNPVPELEVSYPFPRYESNAEFGIYTNVSDASDKIVFGAKKYTLTDGSTISYFYQDVNSTTHPLNGTEFVGSRTVDGYSYRGICASLSGGAEFVRLGDARSASGYYIVREALSNSNVLSFEVYDDNRHDEQFSFANFLQGQMASGRSPYGQYHVEKVGSEYRIPDTDFHPGIAFWVGDTTAMETDFAFTDPDDEDDTVSFSWADVVDGTYTGQLPVLDGSDWKIGKKVCTNPTAVTTAVTFSYSHVTRPDLTLTFVEYCQGNQYLPAWVSAN